MEEKDQIRGSSPMRRAFINTLTQYASTHDNIILLTGDLGYNLFDDYISIHPNRFINVGVAEANLASIAAGLATTGYHPVIYSIASFLTGRAFEQIRLDIAYHNLPVTLIGAGGGYTYSRSGVTHHAAEDLGLMSLIPNMTVTAPGDPTEVSELLSQLLDLSSPSYMRLGRFGEPTFSAMGPIELGKIRFVRGGIPYKGDRPVAIITTGDMITEVLSGYDHAEGDEPEWRPALYQAHTLQPLDLGGLMNIYQKHRQIIVVEEHFPQGCLYERICSEAPSRSHTIHRLGPPHSLSLDHLSQPSLRKHYNYDIDSISSLCRQLVGIE